VKIAELTFEGYFWRSQVAGWGVTLVEVGLLALAALAYRKWQGRRRRPSGRPLAHEGDLTIGKNGSAEFRRSRPWWAPRPAMRTRRR
jgi:hypothetical protein